MVGIVILNYRTPEDVFKCIDSIYKNVKANFKIYIVDNNSQDGSMDKFRKRYTANDEICLIENKENKGYSQGNNCGIKQAMDGGADYICISNPDVLFVNDAISEMLNAFSSEKIAAVGPYVYDEDGNQTQFARKKLTMKMHALMYKPFYYLKHLRKKAEKERYIDFLNAKGNFVFRGFVSGCCFMMKSDIFKKCNLFDEEIFLYSEEDILAYKLDILNLDVSIASDAKVIHACGNSTGSDESAFSRYNKRISVMYLFRAYQGCKATYWVYALYNIALWGAFSVIDKDARKFFKAFVSKMFSFGKIQPERGLKDII